MIGRQILDKTVFQRAGLEIQETAQYSAFGFCTCMHPTEDNMHWISPNPNQVHVFGEKGKGASATLKIARNGTGEVKIVNEENGMEGES